MTFNKFALASAIVGLAMAASSIANAEVSATAGIASTYLWRGLDLGSGTPAVSGELKFSKAGIYSGIWGSSGDEKNGSEYDLTLGYNGAIGDFSYGLGAINYNYPSDAETDIGELSDAVLTLGYGPVAFGAYVPVGREDSSGDYMYFTLGASFSAFSILMGVHSSDLAGGGVVGCDEDESSKCTPVHLDFTYAYNDNLSFTFSQFVMDGPADDRLKFVVSYGLPIGE